MNGFKRGLVTESETRKQAKASSDYRAYVLARFGYQSKYLDRFSDWYKEYTKKYTRLLIEKGVKNGRQSFEAGGV